MTHPPRSFCERYQRAVDILAKRWTPLIIRVLLDGGCRFTDLTASIPGLSDRLVAERLRELEAEGIVERRVYGDRPVKVEYRLTPKGLALEPVVNELQAWADTWAPTVAGPPRRASTPPGESGVYHNRSQGTMPTPCGAE